MVDREKGKAIKLIVKRVLVSGGAEDPVCASCLCYHLSLYKTVVYNMYIFVHRPQKTVQYTMSILVKWTCSTFGRLCFLLPHQNHYHRHNFYHPYHTDTAISVHSSVLSSLCLSHHSILTLSSISCLPTR